MKKPNLFIVGHPRTGTSSLHDYLNQHPDVFMSPIKEPNYFARDFHEESDNFHKKKLYFPFRTENQYLSLYRKWGDEKIAGEASATSLYSKVSAERIAGFNKDAKIIMMFREPVDFLFSYHSTAIFSLGENFLDFRKALSVEQERKQGKLLGKRVLTPSFLYYSEFIKYEKQVKRFLSFFSTDQLKIIIFDDFKKETDRIHGDILRFLDVDTGFVPDFTIVNPYKKNVKWPRLKYYLFDSPYFRKTQRLLLPYGLYAKLVRIYKKTIQSSTAKSNIDLNLKKELMKKYKGEVERLGDLLQRDLVGLWGYDRA